MTDTTVTAERFEIGAPHRELLDQVLDKWSLEVLNELCEQPARFSELRRAIPAVTQKSLTATLRRLERNGIVERILLSSRPVAVEYKITPLGKSLRPPIDVILAWVSAKMPLIEESRRVYDAEVDGLPHPEQQLRGSVLHESTEAAADRWQ